MSQFGSSSVIMPCSFRTRGCSWPFLCLWCQGGDGTFRCQHQWGGTPACLLREHRPFVEVNETTDGSAGKQGYNKLLTGLGRWRSPPTPTPASRPIVGKIGDGRVLAGTYKGFFLDDRLACWHCLDPRVVVVVVVVVHERSSGGGDRL